MSYYRLYYLNPRSGHIDRFEEFEAEDDTGALSHAERRLDHSPLELWSGGRKIVHLDPVAPNLAGLDKLQAAAR